MFGATVAAGLMADTDLGMLALSRFLVALRPLLVRVPRLLAIGLMGARLFAPLSMLEVFGLLEGRVRSPKNLLVVLMSMIKRALAR